MKKKVSLKKKLSYWFDNIMAKGTVSLVLLLFGITSGVVILAGLIAAIIDGQSGLAVGNSIWVSLMHAIDAGTLAGDSGNILFIILMSVVTVCGLFITSMLIGIINTGLEGRMAALRKGKSQVLEQNHVVILGFNEGTFTILTELIEANSNQKKSSIVLLDEMDKDEMEAAISQRISDFKTSRIICRSGKISHFSDLEICSIDTCRSIIINGENDFLTIKAVLAATNLLKKSQNTDAYITAIIYDEANISAAKIAGEGYAEILYFKNTIARIMAHTCRQPGLSNVFTELFDYGGDEIYIEEIPGISGRSMKELCLFFPKASILGIQRGSRSMLNPPADTIVEASDRLIVLAADDGISIPTAQPAAVNSAHLSNDTLHKAADNQNTLILGVSEMLREILVEDDAYMPDCTHFLVAYKEDSLNSEYLPAPDELSHISLATKACDIYNKLVLEELITADIRNILILSDLQDTEDESDAKTLLLLLQLRHIVQQKNLDVSITSEMRKVENQALAQVTGVNDFVISSNITSLMLTQISQTRSLKGIFEELLTSDGSEIYMKPAQEYVTLNQPVSLFAAASVAAARSEVFIGYRSQKSSYVDYDLIINPRKDSTFTFKENDCFIVIAQD